MTWKIMLMLEKEANFYMALNRPPTCNSTEYWSWKQKQHPLNVLNIIVCFCLILSFQHTLLKQSSIYSMNELVCCFLWIHMIYSPIDFRITWLLVRYFVQAPLLSNRISVIHGSRINYETICCPQFCTYSYQILCHVGGTSPPTWHKIW